MCVCVYVRHVDTHAWRSQKSKLGVPLERHSQPSLIRRGILLTVRHVIWPGWPGSSCLCSPIAVSAGVCGDAGLFNTLRCLYSRHLTDRAISINNTPSHTHTLLYSSLWAPLSSRYPHSWSLGACAHLNYSSQLNFLGSQQPGPKFHFTASFCLFLCILGNAHDKRLRKQSLSSCTLRNSKRNLRREGSLSTSVCLWPSFSSVCSDLPILCLW